MIQPAPKPKPVRALREQLRQALAAPAWRLWTSLARNDVMAETGDRERFQERHKLVLALIEVNSQQLRCDSQSAGLDIERLDAQRDVERTNNAGEARAGAGRNRAAGRRGRSQEAQARPGTRLAGIVARRVRRTASKHARKANKHKQLRSRSWQPRNKQHHPDNPKHPV